MNSNISAEEVRRIFNYDRDTGLLTWRVKTNSRVHVGGKVGSVDSKGYLRTKIKGVDYRQHRLIWLYVTGEMPDFDIDHINLDKTDNRWENLRLCTKSQNSTNHPHQSHNTLRVKNVSPYGSRFRASVCKDGKYHKKYFDCIEDASQWARQKRIELHREFRHD